MMLRWLLSRLWWRRTIPFAPFPVPAPRPKYELMTRISVAEDLRMRGYFDGEELQPIDYATIINGAGLRR